MNEGWADGYCPHVELAKAAIRVYTERGETVKVTADGALVAAGGVVAEFGARGAPDFSPLLAERAGAFVSIKKMGALRGCIGTITPVRDNLAGEIADNAISACSRDPRFDPVKPYELDDLTVSVDVLSAPEPVDSAGQLDAARYGVIVTKGFRRGLLLPNLEGVDTVEAQINIALSKAGIGPSERYTVERFEVVRYELGGAMRGDVRDKRGEKRDARRL